MPTEPRWYIDQMRNEANRECYEESPEYFYSYDEAIGWCVDCAGPIFEDQPIAHLAGYQGASVDRHGETYVFTLPETLWHGVRAHCQSVPSEI